MATDPQTCGDCPHKDYDEMVFSYRCYARSGGGLGGAPMLKTNPGGLALRLASCRRTKEERGGSDV